MEAKGAFRIVGLLALAATGVVALPLICGFFARLHPAFDSLAHFRVHLAILLLIAAIPLLFLRGLRWNGILSTALGAGAILSVAGVSWIVGPSAQAALKPPDETKAVYRLLHLNLRYDNPEHGKVLSLIGRLMPDIITLNEVSPVWAEKTALLAGSYRYRVVCHIGNHAGGVAILSLRPFADGDDGQCLEGGSFATADIDLGGNAVEIGAMHLYWPWPFDQADQIEDLAPLLGAMGASAILAGDLNATPWSAASARIAEAAGMTPFGPSQPTWLYRKLPEFLRFSGLPIDRVFAKGDVAIQSVETLEAVGSDHLPVLVEFSVVPAEGEPRPQSETAWFATGAAIR